MTRLRSSGDNIKASKNRIFNAPCPPFPRRTISDPLCTAFVATKKGISDISFLARLMTRTYEDFEAAASILSMKMQAPNLGRGRRIKLVIRRKRDPFGAPITEVPLRQRPVLQATARDENTPPLRSLLRQAPLRTSHLQSTHTAEVQHRGRFFEDTCLHGVLGSLATDMPAVGKYMTRGAVRRVADVVCERIQAAC